MDTAPQRGPHRLAVVCLAALLASACSDSPAPIDRAAPAARPDASQASGSPEDADVDPLQARYQATRAAFTTMQARGELAEGAFDTVLYTGDDVRAMSLDAGGCPGSGQCAFDLINCMSGTDYVPTVPEGEAVDYVEMQLASAAFEVLRLEHLLRAQRYPEAVWRPALERYEDDTLRALRRTAPTSENFSDYTDNDTRLQEALLSSLVAHRAQSDRSLLLPVAEGGCGAGEMGVQVATDPPGGTAEFIPVFHYRLCGVRGVDPDDTRACDHWREAAEGLLFDVAGDYRYRVRWQDGHVSRGKLSFTNLEEGQTVTLRRR